ncbi:MAG TPA: nucleotidyltransferase domain-containing protein [Candidatus Competibacteraceae bacterium]|nr:nucleotidyltransferase domain-containing protein [Candidatus Competibacteraceae bacterium]
MRHTDSTETPEALSPEQLEALVPKWVQIARNAPVLLLYLHGSYAKGTQTPLSDIDLAVLLEPEHSRDYGLYGELQSAFQDACGRDDIDLVIFNTAGPIIRDRVIRHGRLLYARREAQRIAFEADALKRAMDFRYFSKVYDDALFRQLREGRWHD